MSCTFTKEQEVKIKELENEINLDIENRLKNGEILSLRNKVQITVDHLGDSFKVNEKIIKLPVADEEGYIPFSIFEEDA